MSFRRTYPILIALCISVVAAASLAAQKLTPEEIVKRHTEQTFATTAPEPGRNASGSCGASRMMGSGEVEGAFELKTTTETVRFDLRFGIPTYEGESIVFDGKGVDVGFAQRRTSTRSALGSFLSTYALIVGDGLFGGVLNRRWPLRDVQGREIKLSSDGLKKLEGRELHRLRYRVPRNQGDLTIHLYFEPDTFRHLASVYSASRSQNATELQPTAQQPDERFTVTERFSEFETTPAGTVPKAWVIHYTRAGGKSIEWTYQCKLQSVTNAS
jgi:hypothetical protein